MALNIPDITPELSDKAKEKLSSLPEGSVALVAADIDYAIKNISYIVNYSKTFESCVKAPILICAIFNSSAIDSNFSWKANVLKSKISDLAGIMVIDFVAKGFEQDKDLWLRLRQSSSQLLINYIKCARFTLVQQLWSVTKHCKISSKIGQSKSLVYVMDFDFIAKDNFDDKIVSEYPDSSCLLSYNIQDDHGAEKFMKNLCYTSILNKSNSIKVDVHFSHKTIKAGFSCFSQTNFTNLFFLFFNQYAFQISTGENMERIDNYLCSHYYGDQLSLIAAARELRYAFEDNYFDELAWINIGKSKIVNLSYPDASHLYFPKGTT